MPDEPRAKPPQDTASSHDKLFKTLFRCFLDQLVELVEPGVAARLDLSTIRFLGESRFVDFRKHGHLEPDLVAEIMTRDPEPLAALMRSKRWDRVEQKIRCLDAIARADLDIQRRFLLAKLPYTYLQLTEDEEARFREHLKQTANKEAYDMIVTWDEALADREQKGIAIGEQKGIAIGEQKGIAIGEQKGIAIGEARGVALGEAKATQDAILRVAARRHTVRNGFAEQIRAIQDLKRLNEILDRILDVDSLDDIELS